MAQETVFIKFEKGFRPSSSQLRSFFNFLIKNNITKKSTFVFATSTPKNTMILVKYKKFHGLATYDIEEALKFFKDNPKLGFSLRMDFVEKFMEMAQDFLRKNKQFGKPTRINVSLQYGLDTQKLSLVKQIFSNLNIISKPIRKNIFQFSIEIESRGQIGYPLVEFVKREFELEIERIFGQKVIISGKPF